MYTANIQPESEVIGSLPLLNPEAEGRGVNQWHFSLRIYQWQTSNDRGMRVVYLVYTPNSRGLYDIYYGEAMLLAYKCCIQCAIYLQQGYIHTYIIKFNVIYHGSGLGWIKTHDSESRGQEEAGRTQRTSELFTRSIALKFVNALNKPP